MRAGHYCDFGEGGGQRRFWGRCGTTAILGRVGDYTDFGEGERTTAISGGGGLHRFWGGWVTMYSDLWVVLGLRRFGNGWETTAIWRRVGDYGDFGEDGETTEIPKCWWACDFERPSVWRFGRAGWSTATQACGELRSDICLLRGAFGAVSCATQQAVF